MLNSFLLSTSRPVGDGLEVTYIVRIALNGSIPRTIVDKVAAEIPTCVGRARDTFYASKSSSRASIPSVSGGLTRPLMCSRLRTLHPAHCGPARADVPGRDVQRPQAAARVQVQDHDQDWSSVPNRVRLAQDVRGWVDHAD